jgi:hypothetical protein
MIRNERELEGIAKGETPEITVVRSRTHCRDGDGYAGAYRETSLLM